MKELQKLMNEISAWSDETFGNGQRNPAIIYHLKKEVDELILAFEQNKNNPSKDGMTRICFEYADCLMLLLDSAKHFGMTSGILFWYLEEKLRINKHRTWGNPDENGVIEHLK